ncbi:MAG: hypothetical protein KDJ31_18125, partial [Candidatus Competibacteraceae bacterium]|nr:hypothetical protein [Candidatus Competibacteraceae bacterium]
QVVHGVRRGGTHRVGQDGGWAKPARARDGMFWRVAVRFCGLSGWRGGEKLRQFEPPGLMPG